MPTSFAHFLRGLGVGPEAVVGLCAERSLDLVVGALGILKAGGGYLPLDPTYPADRLAFMLRDAGARVLVAQESRSGLDAVDARVVLLDADWAVIARESSAPPDHRTLPDNLAYVIYTSGSTGRPKGAMNSHRAICNRLDWMRKALPISRADRVLHKASISFDVSVAELFWPLITGRRWCSRVPGDSTTLTTSSTSSTASRSRRCTSCRPCCVHSWKRPGWRGAPALRRVVCSGEALPANLQNRFFELLGADLYNLYGPTEAAVDVTVRKRRRASHDDEVPIGRPLANARPTSWMPGCSRCRSVSRASCTSAACASHVAI